jgi:hypothetical protein
MLFYMYMYVVVFDGLYLLLFLTLQNEFASLFVFCQFYKKVFHIDLFFKITWLIEKEWRGR